jgi:hypothetical protein
MNINAKQYHNGAVYTSKEEESVLQSIEVACSGEA